MTMNPDYANDVGKPYAGVFPTMAGNIYASLTFALIVVAMLCIPNIRVGGPIRE